MSERFMKVQALYRMIELEPFILMGLLLAIAWIFYKFFLQEVSPERHKSIRQHFRVLVKHYVFLSFLFLAFIFVQSSEGQIPNIERLSPYIALLTFVWGNIVLVKVTRLIVLQYLFLGSMKHGVPLLIVNMVSLLLSIALLFWGLSTVFGVDLAPLLATSAAFSIILGLALQDTLGNLFAGISLQIDKSYEIGDWVECVLGLQKVTGQVREITWRCTTLVGFSDEVITLPNRWMAQAQISNYSPPDHPVIRSQFFRLAYGANIDLAKATLEQVAAGIGEIRGIPAPLAYVHEVTENWVVMKLIYFVDNFGSQFSIGDKILKRGYTALAEAQVQIARQVLEVRSTNDL